MEIRKKSPELSGKKLGLSDEDWAGMVEQMTGHPNEEDVANAKACVREVLG